MQTKFLGYTVEQVKAEVAQGTVAYHLVGPRATYKLVRQDSRPEFMFALNSVGNVSGVKGNYHFTDRKGYLETRR